MPAGNHDEVDAFVKAIAHICGHDVVLDEFETSLVAQVRSGTMTVQQMLELQVGYSRSKRDAKTAPTCTAIASGA